MAVDLETRSRRIFSYARIKVEAESLKRIPCYMVLTIEEEFDLLLEVKMGYGVAGVLLAAGNDGNLG